MLPGLGFSEIIVLAVIALLVVGPKDLPVLFRTLGQWTRKMQSMAAEFRQGFDDLARQAELDELRKEVDALRSTVNPLSEFQQHAADLKREVMSPIDPAAAAPPSAESEAVPEAIIPENFDVVPEPAPEPAPETPVEPSAAEARG